MSDQRVASISGKITLEDGSVSEFHIGTDFGWSQWGADIPRMGESVGILEAMIKGLQDEEIRVVSDYDEDPEDVNDEDEGDDDE